MFFNRAFSVVLLLILCVLTVSGPVVDVQGAGPAKNTNGYLEFGGSGSEPGKFACLRAMIFGPDKALYTLEGGAVTKDFKRSWPGNLRVQKFDDDGKFLAQFSLAGLIEVADKNDPQHLAVDSRGHVFVTFPKANQIIELDKDGKNVGEFSLPSAWAITRQIVGGKERIVALSRIRANATGKTPTTGADSLLIIPTDGSAQQTLKLSQPLSDVQDMTADGKGNLFILAEVNQIYQFDAAGKVACVIGTGTSTRAEDGSELLHSVAVDSHGNLYTMAFGNPGKVVRFDADMLNVNLRPGEFKWADCWSLHSSFVPLAIDSQDRLWASAATLVFHPLFDKFHARPTIMRTANDFLDAKSQGVTRNTTLALGFKAKFESTCYGIAYDNQPMSMDLVVAASKRNIKQCSAEYHVYDVIRNPIAQGRFEMQLEDGVEARHAITFTPPRFGWYTVQVAINSDQTPIASIANHVATTPKYPNMFNAGSGDFVGGWEDAPRMVFTGMSSMRLHPQKGLDKFEQDLSLAQKFNLTYFGQFSDKKEKMTVEAQRPAIEQFKGRVPVWELMNEPNFTMSPEQFVTLFKPIVAMIRQVDPQVKTMGPSVCGVDLNWYRKFYEQGGKDLVDIIAIHDYEGHESIDPVHWRWKIDELRKLMNEFGDGDKPIWQTERAITAVRGGLFMGGQQAIRVTMHRDLMQTLGVPPEHNNNYYLLEGGYRTVPSYLWSSAGAHPAALALRTRTALVKDLKYSGEIDFGPSGSKLFMGLKYDGPQRSVIVLRNLGMRDETINVKVSEAKSLMITDMFGNENMLEVKNGEAQLVLSQFPQYLSFAAGQNVIFPRMDFGTNLAPLAMFTVSVPDAKNIDRINNGIWETIHAGNPYGGTNGNALFSAALPEFPQTVEAKFPKPTKISKVLIAGLRADNAFCSLLDYDLQYHNGKEWVTIEARRTPVPPTDKANSPDCAAESWGLDDNLNLHTFAPVITDRLRVVVLKTTFGFAADERANKVIAKVWGKGMVQTLALREIEIYGAGE